MQTLLITKSDLDADGYYAGPEDVTNYAGHIEIAADLGVVRFKLTLRAKGRIRALAGSGISAGEVISAGWGIRAGSGISAGEGIRAGEGISAGSGISAGDGISAGWGISAGEVISAGWGISAGEGISAGWGISAGAGISAGEGISAGLSIVCKAVIKTPRRIFAGLCRWREPTAEETQVRCRRIEGGGRVAFGTLVEIGDEAAETEAA